MDIKNLEKFEREMLCYCTFHKSDSHCMCKRERIVSNLKIEENISPQIEIMFINLVRKESESLNCEDIEKCLPYVQKQLIDYMLHGPEATLSEENFLFVKNGTKLTYDANLSPIGVVGSLWDIETNDLPPNDYIFEMYSNGFLSKANFTKPFGNRFEFIWSAVETDVLELIELNSSANDIRDALGLDFENYKEGENLFALSYSKTDIFDIRKPTIIEGANLVPFKPSSKATSTGFTTNLATGENCIREIVHRKIDKPDSILLDIRFIGKLTTDPSQNYLESYRC